MVQDVVFVKKPLDVVQKCANENAKEILCRGNLCLSIFLSLVLGNIAFFDVKSKKVLSGSVQKFMLFFFCSLCSVGVQKASRTYAAWGCKPCSAVCIPIGEETFWARLSWLGWLGWLGWPGWLGWLIPCSAVCIFPFH